MFDITPKHDFLVGIDSDGCAFDTMEVKHKECFIPNIDQLLRPAGREQVRPRGGRVREPVLEEPRDQPLSGAGRDARVAAQAARGEGPRRRRSRFPQSLRRLDQARDEAGQPGAGEGGRGDRRPGLEAGAGLVEGGQRGDRARWSAACRRFPFVRESLEKLSGRADMLVVSATPNEALQREWEEHDLAEYVRGDLRPGDRHEEGDRWPPPRSIPPDHTLMIGDAPGDYQAADGQRRPVLPDQSRRRRGQLEAALRRRASTGSSPARSPASIRRSCWPSSTRYLPEPPPWPMKDESRR